MWSLTVLPDGTIVSGDGDGAVQFWDGRFGTLLSRQQQFAADVLAVVGSPDSKSVWASGVDPRVSDEGCGPAAGLKQQQQQSHSQLQGRTARYMASRNCCCSQHMLLCALGGRTLGWECLKAPSRGMLVLTELVGSVLVAGGCLPSCS